MQNTLAERLIHPHAHHQIAAAIFVASLLLSVAMVLSAELMKPERYEFHPGNTPATYVVYDRDTGRASVVEFDARTPLTALNR